MPVDACHATRRQHSRSVFDMICFAPEINDLEVNYSADDDDMDVGKKEKQQLERALRRSNLERVFLMTLLMSSIT